MADDILKNLLPTPSPAAASDFADQPTAQEREALGKMYPRTPEPLEPGEGLYSISGMLRTCLNRNFVRLSDAGVLTLEQQAAERKEFAGLVRETGLPLAAAELLHDQWSAARLAQARTGDDPTDLAAAIRADNEARRTRPTWWSERTDT
jgi:hypothetical protein